MPNRMAATLSLLVFAVCLGVGIQTDNTFATCVFRAVVAMAGTFVLGLIVGAMGQKMLDESLKTEEKKEKIAK